MIACAEVGERSLTFLWLNDWNIDTSPRLLTATVLAVADGSMNKRELIHFFEQHCLPRESRPIQ